MLLAAAACASFLILWGTPATAQDDALMPPAGTTAQWGDMEARASWLETAAGVDFGLVDFDLRGSRREWNLGIGRSVGRSVGGHWSFLGGGVEVSRPFPGEPTPDEGGPLAGLEVKPWLGGCVACELGTGLRLGVELKWAPDGAAILDDEDAPAEGRAGVSLGLEW